jgi:hypothetical protein
MKICLPGINIQYPISELILSGQKTVETRTYPIPDKYKNVPMLLIETPGRTGKFKSRIRAVIKFNDSFPYKSSKDFYKDIERHAVSPTSLWKWVEEKPKWGWPVEVIDIFETPFRLNKKTGIRFTTSIEIDIRRHSKSSRNVNRV